MTPRLDFTSEAFFRDPPKAIAALARVRPRGRDAISSGRRCLGHHDPSTPQRKS